MPRERVYSPPVTTSEVDVKQLVQKAFGKTYTERPVVYEFSGGKKIRNADEDGCGVYGTSADVVD